MNKVSSMMRQPIRQLSPYITSLIAAGEIVKRPEDIVRELVDNSIDAGANDIEIRITQGGIELIQIKDNGGGIPKDELALALMHHATSKIQALEDIERIKTLGFRGEALASISAVARISLSSRTEDSPHGWEIKSEPGQPGLDPKPAAHPLGTTISVADLFHHIPARRRFLRTPATEFARIHQWIKSLSVNHAKIAFSVFHNQRMVFSCSVEPETSDHRLSRLANLYGPEFATVAIPIQSKDDSYSLSGWLSPPDLSRSQPDWQSVYVNGRVVKDKTISHAVKQAYQDVLYRDRHPIVVLFLAIDPSDVDFNVHPAKAEVRFRKPQLVYELVYQQIKQALHKKSVASFQAPALDTSPEPSGALLKEAISDISFANSGYRVKTPHHPVAQVRHPVTIKQSDQPQTTTHSHGVMKAHQTSLEDKTATTSTSLGQALAQLHGTYILAQNAKGLVVVDAHAAHERILYEQLKQSFTNNTPHRQGLLVPIVLTLSVEDMELAEIHRDVFERIGFTLHKSGAQTLSIQAVPQILSTTALEALVGEVLTDLKEHGLSLRLEAQQNRLLSTMACRQAIHANRSMSVQEMDSLLRLIESTPHSGQCNHGRPTVRQIPFSELDSWFLRGR